MSRVITYLCAAVLLLSVTITTGEKLPKLFRKSFKFIPSGLVLLNGDTSSVQSYYMLDHEVTNAEYLAFLNEIEKEEIQLKAKVNEENWKTELSHPMNNYSEYYFSHPAYANFPVVNVTQEGATLYCEWLEGKINAAMAGKRQVKVRLPHHEELVRAAVGDDLTARYSWKGQYLRNAQGQFLCNFTGFPQELLTRDSSGAIVIKNDLPISLTEIAGADVLAPAKSYYPSEFGVYNLNGNAAEMTQEPNIAAGGSWRSYGYDVRSQSVMNYNEASCLVGFRPVFTVLE